jgi:hypothetical protein
VWIAGRARIAELNPMRPADAPYGDAFVAKFDAEGTPLFATYLDGLGASWVQDLVVDPSGDAYVTGATHDAAFPGGTIYDILIGPMAAFVGRLRADGTGFVWSQTFLAEASLDSFYGGGLVRDPSDGTLLASVVGTRDAAGAPFGLPIRAPRGAPRRAVPTYLVRLGDDGTPRGGTRIDFLDPYPPAYEGRDEGLATPIALAADGSVFVGGQRAVARIAGDFSSVRAWNARSGNQRGIRRIVPLPDGRVLVLNGDAYGNLGELWSYDGRLRRGRGFAGPPTARYARDVAPDGGATLTLAGAWSGAPFGGATAPGDAVDVLATVTRVPIAGVRAPSKCAAKAVDATSADVTWTLDGDRAERFDLEEWHGSGSWRVSAARLLASVGGRATRARVTGLSPGARHFLRVNAAFSNGVRSAAFCEVTTPPVPPVDVVAAAGPGLATTVTWTDPNGTFSGYAVQRRVGDGDWLTISGVVRNAGAASLVDPLPPAAAAVRYRVRAENGVKAEATPWVESAPLLRTPAFVVTQEEGTATTVPQSALGFAHGSFHASGALRPAGGGAVAFDPAKDALHVQFGDAATPILFDVPAGDPGWIVTGGVARWSAARTLTPWGAASEVFLDLAAGRYELSLASAGFGSAPLQRTVVVAFTIGAAGGSALANWRQVSVHDPVWVLR